ncbi:MAG: cytochrome P450 [Myxacorys chilensis ATA2-1-KO14]|jgi:cytochrome P450|nr:cytochrome P450 [Myxacorys chilensis ATA2-1-KO14]
MASSLPPGSTGLPFIGETLQFLTDRNFVQKRYQRHGSVFKSHIIGRPTVFMVGPDAVEFLLSSGFDNFSWRDGWPDTFKLLLGRSLFVQEGEEHRKNRRLMMPAFHGAALARYFSSMEEITQQHLKKWEQQQTLQWYEEFKQLTFDIASQIFLGTPPGKETERLSQLFTTLTSGLLSFPNLPGSQFKKSLAARNALLDHLAIVINQRKENPTDDALSLLLDAQDEEGNRLSFEEIRAQAMLLLFAGHETTTSMLTWFALEVARNKDVYQKAKAEQQTFSDAVTLEQISKMPYLDQIFNEIERLHPPVAGGFRGVVKPFEFNGYSVPAGWLAQYSILHTHRLPEVYPDPEKFDPDRWHNTKQKPFSLIGFGGGSRVCIGLAFAKLEMKLVAAHLLRHYEWELLPHQRLEPVQIPTRRPKDRLRVIFRAID